MRCCRDIRSPGRVDNATRNVQLSYGHGALAMGGCGPARECKRGGGRPLPPRSTKISAASTQHRGRWTHGCGHVRFASDSYDCACASGLFLLLSVSCGLHVQDKQERKAQRLTSLDTFEPPRSTWKRLRIQTAERSVFTPFARIVSKRRSRIRIRVSWRPHRLHGIAGRLTAATTD